MTRFSCHVRTSSLWTSCFPLRHRYRKILRSHSGEASEVDKNKDYLYQLGQSDLNLNIDTGVFEKQRKKLANTLGQDRTWRIWIIYLQENF